jgi:hypothetical protein
MKKVLYINHGISKKCGVYDLGLRHYKTISNIDGYDIKYYEIDDIESYFNICNIESPDAIVFNYMRFTSPWITTEINNYKCVKICVPHLFQKNNFIFPEDPHRLIFDFFIVLDKSSDENNYTFKTSRPILQFDSVYKNKNTIPKIGSFGFGFMRKMLDIITYHVNESFEEAEINFHIPRPHFIFVEEQDRVIQSCVEKITKSGIKINFNTEFLDDSEVILNLNKNDINCLFYDSNMIDGISSSLDYMISAQKPILISDSPMFRSFSYDLPKYPKTSIKDIYDNFDKYNFTTNNLYIDEVKNLKIETKKIFDKVIK